MFPLTPGGAGFLEGGLGAVLVAPHASHCAVGLSVALYRWFSRGPVVLGGGLALLHLQGTTPGEASPAAVVEV